MNADELLQSAGFDPQGAFDRCFARPGYVEGLAASHPMGIVKALARHLVAERLRFSDSTTGVKQETHNLACRQIEKLAAERDAACAYAVELRAMLKAAKCPNAECWDGAVPSGNRDDPDWSQCQWCFERNAALAKNPESPNPTGDTPYRDDAESGKQTGSGVKGPASALTVDDQAEFEVYVGDDFEASTSGPRDRALAEARHYALQYAEDGDVRIEEITRRLVETLHSSGTSTEQEKP